MKVSSLLRDNVSAAVLILPAMCSATTTMR